VREIYQKTILKPLTFNGIGLHTGKETNISILPGNENSGIVFKRVDLVKNNLINANYQNVSSTTLSTTLLNKHGVKVSTVEHLLAALYIAGIDSAIIEVNNEEIPIMDGSAKNFLDILKKTELKQLNKKIKYLKILEKVQLKDGNRKIEISPKDSFEVDFEIKFKNKIIGNQRNTINFHSDNLEEVEESRTFCLYDDIQKIKKMGLAKGGSLDNAIVVDQNKVLNEGGLRNDKEFVNHKILDLAGDFLLSGFRILGAVYCHQGGHQLSNLFLHKLIKSKNKYKIFNFEEKIAKENKISNPHFKLAANA
jgi:UDP-3-O-[3-hydroxymyristoyl] N-acetylglucosamine deacetylase